MILPFHDFGRHVTRCAAVVNAVIGGPQSCYAEICDSEVAFLIKDKVFWLEIPVQDTSVMHLFQAFNHACNKEAGLIFSEHSNLSVMFS